LGDGHRALVAFVVDAVVIEPARLKDEAEVVGVVDGRWRFVVVGAIRWGRLGVRGEADIPPDSYSRPGRYDDRGKDCGDDSPAANQRGTLLGVLRAIRILPAKTLELLLSVLNHSRYAE
jgi:hypothetical protein